jgi:hypothetical protein
MSYSQVWDFLTANWLALVLAVFASSLAVVLYLRAAHGGRLRYTAWGVLMLSSASQTVQVRIGSRRVKGRRVSAVTWLTVWNHGNKAIRRTDISAKDPIAVVFSDGSRLLSKEDVKCTNPANSVEVAEASGRLLVRFDYLNPKDGAVFRLEHTGSEPFSVDLGGSLVDAEGPARMADARSRAGRIATWMWAAYIFVALGVFPLMYHASSWLPGTLAILVLGDLAPAGAAYWFNDPRMVVPKKLEDASVGRPELSNL